MRSTPRRVLHSPIVFGVLLLAGAAISLLVADGINPRPDRPDLGFERVDSTRHSRVLILLVDSWRHETAIDRDIMPEVGRLSAQGASGKLETVFEGFSIPAIRAEFSGSAPTQLMNLIRNFRFRALPIESSFLDASRTGKRALVVGDEPFTQFGPFLEKRLPAAPDLDMYGLDRQRSGIALDAYRSGAYDIVICHYETADWRAHEYGVASPRYASAFAYVDTLVAEFARARRPGDYLLVFGDHGHNERGEHKTGLYIPTHGLFIGPDITPGVVFPSLPVSDVRFVVDHALGIELRAPERETRQLAQFLPVSAAAVALAAREPAAAHVSANPLEWLLFVVFLGGFLAFTAAALRGGVPEPLATASNAVIVLLFVAEFAAQQASHPEWSVFPFLLAGLGLAVWSVDRWRGAVIGAVALYFLSRYTIAAGAPSLIREPVGTAELVPLYIAGSCAKIAIFVAALGRRRWPAAVGVAGALAVLEYRVWDRPELYVAAIAVALAALVRFRGGEFRRAALVAFGFAVLYFTLRLPIYEYAWVDFFILAVWLASRIAPGPWLDALVLTGAFALTSLWLPSGLEWGFLYGLVPAYLVELQVGWFVPLILLKLPMLLLLTWWATDTRPSRRFVALMFVYAGLRFGGVWLVRLFGGTGAQVWPMAEQGIYLTTFAIATVWLYRARVPR